MSYHDFPWIHLAFDTISLFVELETPWEECFDEGWQRIVRPLTRHESIIVSGWISAGRHDLGSTSRAPHAHLIFFRFWWKDQFGGGALTRVILMQVAPEQQPTRRSQHWDISTFPMDQVSVERGLTFNPRPSNLLVQSTMSIMSSRAGTWRHLPKRCRTASVTPWTWL